MLARRNLLLIGVLSVTMGWLLASCRSNLNPTSSSSTELPSASPVIEVTASQTDSAPAETSATDGPAEDQPAPNIVKNIVIQAPPTPLATLPAGDPVSVEEAAQLLEDLSGSDQDTIDAALQRILRMGDTRFISVLIELVRGRQIGLVSGEYSSYYTALEELSGQKFAGDWPAWVEWYGHTDLQPPPGFTGWKGLLLGKIDPGFANFLQDGHPSMIRAEEIQWGGVGVDGIPPLEFAPTLPGAEADYLLKDEPVFGVVVNNDARAYPLRIIDNHEMANDIIGGVPVSLAYCTLCGAAIAYDGRASDGNTYDFGTSGFLYRSNKLMYDRQSRTLWNQLTGRPVLGELAGTGVRLEILPVVLTSWGDWLEQHPDTLVLDSNTGYYHRDMYVPGIFYGDYFSSSETMFPVWQRASLLPDKEFVYALRLNGEPKAYQVEALANDRVLNDTLGGIPIVLVANRGAVSVNGNHRFLGDVVYDVGGEVRVFNRGERTFVPTIDPDRLLDQDGNEWQISEEGLSGPGGERLDRVNGHLAYWFGWYAFFPTTLLYRSESLP